jgi:GH43 family beta-xylosidase
MTYPHHDAVPLRAHAFIAALGCLVLAVSACMEPPDGRDDADGVSSLDTPVVTAVAATPRTLANPILGADHYDPSVALARVPGQPPIYLYPYVERDLQGNVNIWIAATPTLEGVSYPMMKTQIFASSAQYTETWGPQIRYLNGHWYIYASAIDTSVSPNYRRIYVLEADTADPMGSWTNRGRLTPSGNPFHDEADSEVFDNDGKLYFVVAGHDADGVGKLWLSQMSSPTALTGIAILLAAPIYCWEGAGTGCGASLVEAPAAIIKNGTVNIVYSANLYSTSKYALGDIYNVDGNLMNPASWVRKPNPIFAATSQVAGPGSCDFVKSPDGTEDWIVYNAIAQYTSTGVIRHFMTQKLTWNSDNTPNLGAPIAPGVPQQRPAGEDDVAWWGQNVFEAEYGLKNHTNPAYISITASAYQAVGGIAYPDSYVGWTDVNVAREGTYKLGIRYSAANLGLPFDQPVIVNGAAPFNVSLATTWPFGWDSYSYVTFDAALEAGDNTVAFLDNGGNVQLDAMLLPFYQAEGNQLSGNAHVAVRASASLDADVEGLSTPSDCVEWVNNFAAPVSGTQTVRLTYSAGTGAASARWSSDHGETWSTVSLPKTASWDVFARASFISGFTAGWDTVLVCGNTGTFSLDALDYY